MHEYELMYILHPRLNADEANEAMSRVGTLIADRGGELLSAENWGRRRLAYPINHNFEGTYVLSTLQLAPDAAGALEASFRISEDVIRHLLIRGIIPYEGPPAHEDRSRGPRPAASDSPEAVDERDDDVAADGDAVDADEVATAAPVAEAASSAAAADEATAAPAVEEAAPAAPADAGETGSEAGSEAEEPRAAGDAGSTD